MKMFHIAVIAICVITLRPLLSHAQTTTQPSATTQSDIVPVDLDALYPEPLDWQDVNAQLNQKIDDFKVDNQPLSTAIEKFRDLTHLDIDVNWVALTAAGVDKTMLVTINLHNVPVRRVLAALLSFASGANQNNVGFAIHDGVVCISTSGDLLSAKYQIVREYDIDSLMGWAIKNRDEPNDDAIKEILSVITSTVAPDTWRDAGGTIGSLREWHHILYISQTEDNQEQVRQILSAMAVKAMPIIRVYDVRSLIADPDKIQSTGRLMDVLGLIRDQCPPETWGYNGAMTARNGFLIISANSLSQARIAALLDAARKIDAKTAAPPK